MFLVFFLQLQADCLNDLYIITSSSKFNQFEAHVKNAYKNYLDGLVDQIRIIVNDLEIVITPSSSQNTHFKRGKSKIYALKMFTEEVLRNYYYVLYRDYIAEKLEIYIDGYKNINFDFNNKVSTDIYELSDFIAALRKLYIEFQGDVVTGAKIVLDKRIEIAFGKQYLAKANIKRLSKSGIIGMLSDIYEGIETINLDRIKFHMETKGLTAVEFITDNVLKRLLEEFENSIRTAYFDHLQGIVSGINFVIGDKELVLGNPNLEVFYPDTPAQQIAMEDFKNRVINAYLQYLKLSAEYRLEGFTFKGYTNGHKNNLNRVRMQPHFAHINEFNNTIMTQYVKYLDGKVSGAKIVTSVSNSILGRPGATFIPSGEKLSDGVEKFSETVLQKYFEYIAEYSNELIVYVGTRKIIDFAFY